MVTQAEAETFNRTIKILDELAEIPIRVTKSGGSNISHYLALLRETFCVLSKYLPELQGSFLLQDLQSINAVGEEDTIKPETVEQLRNHLLNSRDHAEASKPKEPPPVPPRKQIEGESDSDIYLLTATDNQDFERLISLFIVLLNCTKPQKPPRPDLRTRAVRPSRSPSTKRLKETPPSGSNPSPKGKEKSTSEKSTEDS
ncbi:hypothetical protein F4774DRAFT_409518 [Daldinia eschscholtzii]|nr:hypothetical protein F4774DRAFT_409518 [Daldinia eschscholtzii]